MLIVEYSKLLWQAAEIKLAIIMAISDSPETTICVCTPLNGFSCPPFLVLVGRMSDRRMSPRINQFRKEDWRGGMEIMRRKIFIMESLVKATNVTESLAININLLPIKLSGLGYGQLNLTSSDDRLWLLLLRINHGRDFQGCLFGK